MKSRLPVLPLSLLLCAQFACAPKQNFIPGTQIDRTDLNESVIARVEEYRQAVEKKDAAKILLMASENYWEDSGTPSGEDDYGYDGLKELLASRFQQADSIRYSMRYMKLRRPEGESTVPTVFVDVLIDASFTIPDASGGLKRADKRDQGQFVLEWNEDKDQWMFLSGM